MKKVSILIFTFCLILSSCATSKRTQQDVSITATQWKLITVATSSKELKPSEENP
jgi:starvation-inducible outer membrane lipoprotein